MTGMSPPLLAIADLHGDLKQAFKALLLAGAVDEQGAWAGGDATLVQTGDMFDRGPESLAVLGLLERLKARNAVRVVWLTVLCLLMSHYVQAAACCTSCSLRAPHLIMPMG